MNKTIRVGIVVLVLLGVFSLCNIETASASSKVVRFQCIYTPNAQAAQNYIFFSKRVGELSGGDLQVKIYWANQLVKTKEAFSALSRGMIDGLGAALFYYSGIIPESSGDNLPFAWTDPYEAAEVLINRGLEDTMREACVRHGIYYVTGASAATTGIITKGAVRKLEDLKGLKLKAGGIQGFTAQALGATPVSLTTGEIFMGLQRGTIDGVVYPWYVLTLLKYHEVCGYVIDPAQNTPAIIAILLNQKVWEGLSLTHKEIIDRAGRETLWYSLLRGLVRDQEVRNACEELGVEIIKLSPEEKARFVKATKGVYEDHAKKSEICAKQVEIIKKYMQEKGRW